MKGKVFIAGGGTGGHFYPAVSVAEKLKENGYSVYYFGTENGIEGKKKFPAEKVFLYDIKGVRGRSFKGKIVSSLKLLKTALSIRSIIKREDPEFVITFGGYASLPLGLSALLTGKDLYIHEQNSVPSYTNLLLSKFAKKVFITFDHSRRYFPAEKTVLTGFPLRKDIIEDKELGKERARDILGVDSERKTVLVFGGSQGAKKLTETALKVAGRMKDVQFIIIAGKGYTDTSNNENVKIYRYYDRMGVLYSAADLVVSRAGAGSVWEIVYYGKPAIFVPYPYAASDHQFYNVRWLEEKGEAEIIRDDQLDDELLYKKIREYLDKNSQGNIKKYSIIDTAEKILKEIENDRL
ncbi:MAG TPA: undecaprenyldiphospho-muramoylpentapeptide beta-N-acetylglucosaminyltransferase [Persephonella sp.]|uniref:UDP-N-acetylglucosamine--N-acetylmuramyl-(pentapeptide) pyrophosphoryl-undecaprenol N-acetylglucosamine transferase n=1 Tax=Persephonella marina (strain DSM 14350 / EX-H1) TaxID=123214 RepID=C0QUP6_PERMH|nr:MULTISPECIES: undecaprenyldiphospho-muramoylpentapeptide beta-N-acetylglucosaminyltransferase [Persephonella]ACO03278.1 undecaprenyldiphospho-muramoylpentapeptide beta-N-acetylglucosaminyltransferase [Persephonella marina EX-H1]HCB69973.1 undecaprenyldiphospho-muramoylpentapeptide beta-N-acetylglucosaminyltransferase [Persephonella sp.]